MGRRAEPRGGDHQCLTEGCPGPCSSRKLRRGSAKGPYTCVGAYKNVFFCFKFRTKKYIILGQKYLSIILIHLSLTKAIIK